MEARIARIEDVADIKTDVRSLRDKVDELGLRLDAKIHAAMERAFGWL